MDIATEDTYHEAVFRATGLGMPSLALVLVPPKISQADPQTVQNVADSVITDIITGLTRPSIPVPVERSAEPISMEIRVKNGENPGSIPFRYMDKVLLHLNLKMAELQGIEFPKDVVDSADRILQNSI